MAKTLKLLVAMGSKQREAQAMLDRVKARVGRGPEVNDVLRAALRTATVPGYTLPHGVAREAFEQLVVV